MEAEETKVMLRERKGKLRTRRGREAAYDGVMVSDLGILEERRHRW